MVPVAVVEQYVKVVEGEQEYHSSRGMDDVPSIILKSLEQSPSDLKLQRAGLSLLTWLGEELPAKEGHTFQRQPGESTMTSCAPASSTTSRVEPFSLGVAAQAH